MCVCEKMEGKKEWREGRGNGGKEEAKGDWKGGIEGVEEEKVITGEGVEGQMKRGKGRGRWRFGSH